MSQPQAIAGVSSQQERTVAITYPSISAWGIGRALGVLYESIPIRLGVIKLSYLLFPLPLAPVTLLLYLLQKGLGNTYEVTNRSVRTWSMSLGKRGRLVREVDLDAIDDVGIEQSPGQVFFKASDLHLLAPDGSSIAVLPAVVHAATFRQTILKARDARRQTDAALGNIKARATA